MSIESEMIERMRKSETGKIWKTGLTPVQEAACHTLAERGVFTEGSVAFAVKELPPPRRWYVFAQVVVQFFDVEATDPEAAKAAVERRIQGKFPGEQEQIQFAVTAPQERPDPPSLLEEEP